jgi:hypothetical protein
MAFIDKFNCALIRKGVESQTGQNVSLTWWMHWATRLKKPPITLPTLGQREEKLLDL